MKPVSFQRYVTAAFKLPVRIWPTLCNWDTSPLWKLRTRDHHSSISNTVDLSYIVESIHPALYVALIWYVTRLENGLTFLMRVLKSKYRQPG